MKQNRPTLASTELMYSWLCVRQQVSNLSQVTLSSMEKEPHVLQERTLDGNESVALLDGLSGSHTPQEECE